VFVLQRSNKWRQGETVFEVLSGAHHAGGNEEGAAGNLGRDKVTYRLLNGDCIEVLKTLPDASVDSVVTDPPYELGFMGKKWDASGIAYNVELWQECLRVLKPGGHLLSFGGTRTYHRMAVAIEDAGFEIRDSLHWICGSGFPKSLDVSKVIDKAAGARGHEGKNFRVDGGVGTASYRATVDPREYVRPEPITDATKSWLGWGTALKPAHEPVVVARKPLVGTVAANVQQHGTGALNIDVCRVPGKLEGDPNRFAKTDGGSFASFTTPPVVRNDGRWPPNILLSHTPECAETCAKDCPVAEMDRQSGTSTSKAAARGGTSPNPMSWGTGREDGNVVKRHTDSGGASRFFPVFRYQAKASRSERGQDNKHPTVKPVALMAWLVKLVTPPGGTVLDPFMGSGTTGVAAVGAGFAFIGIEREAEYFRICEARVVAATPEQPEQKELFA